MKNKMMGHFWPTVFLLLFIADLCSAKEGAIPVNNPTIRYNKNNNWTGMIKWKNVVNAFNVAKMIDENNHVDSARLVALMSGIAKKDGGVVYFPAGTYFFNYNLPLFNRVIIRGADISGDPQKNDPAQAWATKFVFSKLVVNRRNIINAGDKIASTDPRIIFNESDKSDILGLVNIDINRASVKIGGNNHTNMLLLNLRINNASLLDPAVPTSIQVSTQHGDQRWPDKSKGVIDVHSLGKTLIAGCIINDDPNENFAQNDYTLDDGMRYDGSEAMFRFSDHPVVCIESKNAAGDRINLVNNRFYITKGNVPVLVNSKSWSSSNEVIIIKEEPSKLINGREPVDRNYELISSGHIKSVAKSYQSNFGEVLKYRLIKPVNYDSTKSYPLIVFFHDSWERGSDNKNQTRQFIWQLFIDGNENKYPCFILAPQLPQTEVKWKCEGLDVETWTARLTKEIIDLEVKANNIDQKRIFCIGESLGAAGAIDMAVQFPDTFAALVPISGFYRFTKNSALQLRNIPIWLIYGFNDDKLKQIDKYNPRLALETAKANVQFTDFPGTGHRCWNSVTSKQPDFLPWLFAQAKK